MDNLTCPVCGDHVQAPSSAHAVNNEPMHHTRACPDCGSVLTRTADERSPWLARVAFRWKRPWSENVQPPYPVQWATVTITEGGRDRDYNVVVDDELQDLPGLARVAELLRGADNEAVIFDELDERLESVPGLANPAVRIHVERPDAP